MPDVDINALGDQIANLTLKQAKELSDYIKEKYGIEPAAGGGMMMMPAGGAGGGAAAPEAAQTEFDVVIKDAGAKKIDVIKVVRQLTSLGLGEAKTLAETAGSKVLTGVGKDAAMAAKKSLEEAGASVSVE